MKKELTLTGELFKSYAEDLIKKDRFGTNKMLGYPTFWIALEKEYEQNEELINQKLAEYVDKKVAEERKFNEELIKDWNAKKFLGRNWTLEDRTEKDIFNGRTEAEYRAYMTKSFHWVGVCDARDVATEELKKAQQFLLDNGYLKVWKKKAPFGKNAYYYFYGLTEKGWAVAPKYLNA